jgi:hypothetical protein
VKFIEIAFRLGVLFAIFGFIWGFFQLFLNLIRGLRKKSLLEEYSLKFVQYFFLVDVTFLFCINKQDDDSQLLLNELILSAFILILYFVGKLQKKQQQNTILKLSGNRISNLMPLFHFQAEVAAIIFGISVFIFFSFFPTFASNPISNWFYSSILDIESTPIFGFIFKVIGFFVLIGILLKILNGITFLISGKPIASVKSEFHSSKRDEFDDFEEIN